VDAAPEQLPLRVTRPVNGDVDAQFVCGFAKVSLHQLGIVVIQKLYPARRSTAQRVEELSTLLFCIHRRGPHSHRAVARVVGANHPPADRSSSGTRMTRGARVLEEADLFHAVRAVHLDTVTAQRGASPWIPKAPNPDERTFRRAATRRLSVRNPAPDPSLVHQ
jgi:hypothetical protein